ncbi:MAG TPA: hypothetical protein ENJ92_00585, partial [Chloroflexi bacterium]|nr:hypothetical protein [Chloroflexota bacterium]
MVEIKEKGRSGTEISGGVIRRPYIPTTVLGDDYNDDITYAEIDAMLRSDGQVGGVTKAIAMAIEQADFSLIPYVDRKGKTTKRDIEIAEFVEKNLEPLWPALLSQAIDAFWYGFTLFQPVHKVVDGQIWWDRFSPRLPFTISEWAAKEGHVKSVTQYAYDYRTQQYRYFTIPGTSLLRFTNEQRGENFEGISLLRAGRKHWKYKDKLYLLSAIQQEKFAVPTVVGALPSTATDEDVNKYKEVLKGLHSNEYGYVWLGKVADSPDFSIDKCIQILQPEGNSAGNTALLELIHHHDILFARSLLAQFVNLGESRAGTRNLSNDMNNLFLMNLEALTKYIAHVVSVGNRGEYGGIKTLVDLNFDNVEGYPSWRCGRTKKTDTAQISAVIAQLVQSGAMQPDESLETYLRRILGIPQDRKPSSVVKKQETHEHKHDNFRLSERPLFDYEKNVAFEEIESELDNST